ncbi:PilN domain-containing protein [Halanaerobium congolense]|jgi:type IV pilus assembly protein PilN|uniref:Type IV pilus assembly protein PilN n=1 Tax=Halanaerobium congolense TaxID=54121 RepID=A0A1G6HZD2_9FIRM|nr:PilN domain-containing protein [Halanaerobium congolense]TDP27065.1 type IV pilus assembly protein PilN [Halanaerobium congolense]SDB98836.1 type IV pilus assembly protein PilN [Halanaerobium congolense]SDG78977.1 type IV pilus assembly protein PilN [Halanaerobium congolense]
MRINLIKEEKKKISFDYFGVALLLAVLIPVMLIGIIHFSLISERNYVQTEISNLESQLEVYLPKEREFKEFEEIVNKLNRTPTVPGYNWDGPIEALGYITPLRGVIDNFSVRQRSLNIRGRTRVGEELAEFRQSLIDSPYFTNIKLDTMEKQKIVTFIITAEIVGEEAE